jgi:hypothetical protein
VTQNIISKRKRIIYIKLLMAQEIDVVCLLGLFSRTLSLLLIRFVVVVQSR